MQFIVSEIYQNGTLYNTLIFEIHLVEYWKNFLGLTLTAINETVLEGNF